MEVRFGARARHTRDILTQSKRRGPSGVVRPRFLPQLC